MINFNELFEYKDGKLLRKITRYGKCKGQEAGSFDRQGYRYVRVDNKCYRTHRIIFWMHHGYMPQQLDHINLDKSDNRIENLRPCTTQQNAANRKARSNSGLKGVSLSNKGYSRYRAQIKANGKSMFLGCFPTKEDAAIAYDKAAKQYFGEFAYINNK
jgi:hypothetical protein